ncbi:unnamed protein product [Lymnaea stagnalis]|uniref:VWFD domain-containing protein n=1 Tax=Lymnaea stagnalis TaxID=6523 RepID=A0AAV2H336_LYMST
MLLHVLLLTTVLLVGQVSSLAITQGAGRCVEGADYTVADDRCRCRSGLKGHGTLCCKDSDLGVCFLRGDPILNTAHDLVSSISYPCSANIALIKREINGKTCEVRVSSAGPYERDGYIFNDRVRVSISYGSIKSSFQFVTPKTYLEPKISNETHEITKDLVLEKLKMFSLNFSMSTDDAHNISILRACGAEVIYRPPNHSETKQTLEPGICVISPPDTIGSDLAEDVCNQNPDLVYAPYASREEKILASMISGYESVDDRDRFNPQSYNANCLAVSTTFKDCSDKVKALSVCGPILLSTPVRKCLTNHANVKVFPTFLECLNATCTNDRIACGVVRSSPAFEQCLPQARIC